MDGGLLGKAPTVNGVKITGGPQMYQLSLDGKRMYVTTSLFSTWDNQFYPEIRTQGGAMIMIDCDVENGGMKINKDFILILGKSLMALADVMKVDIQVEIAQVIYGYKENNYY